MLSGRRVPGTGRRAAALTESPLAAISPPARCVRRALAEDPETRFDSPLDFAEARLTRSAPACSVSERFVCGPARAEPPPERSRVGKGARSGRVAAAARAIYRRRKGTAARTGVAASNPAALVVEPPPQPRSTNAAIPIVESQEPPEPCSRAEATDGELKGGPITSDEITPRARRPATSVDLTGHQAPPRRTRKRTITVSTLTAGVCARHRHRRSALPPGLVSAFAEQAHRPTRRRSPARKAQPRRLAQPAGAKSPKPAPPAAAQPEPPRPASPRSRRLRAVGSLLVRSTPPGARVFVDGREYGLTPVDRRQPCPRRTPGARRA